VAFVYSSLHCQLCFLAKQMQEEEEVATELGATIVMAKVVIMLGEDKDAGHLKETRYSRGNIYL